MRNTKTIGLLGVVALLAMATPTLALAPVEIVEVLVDHGVGMIYVLGNNFGSEPVATLGDVELEVLEPSDHVFTAPLPELPPGSYRLHVMRPGLLGILSEDEFEITLGAVGPQGTQGEPGPQGEQGPQGPMGLPGPQGSPGNDGEDGTKWFVGSGQPDPPIDGSRIGDLYLDQDTGNVWEGVSLHPDGYVLWSFLASIEGPPGPQGDQGPQGQQGEPGEPGPAGPPGPSPSAECGGEQEALWQLNPDGSWSCRPIGLAGWRRPSEDIEVSPQAITTRQILCGDGELPLGGGAQLLDDSGEIVTNRFISGSWPTFDSGAGLWGWAVQFTNLSLETWDYRLFVVCARGTEQ